MRVVVRPASDGHDMRGNWEVSGRGKTTSHTTKQAAKNEADRRANEGDLKVYHGTNGRIVDKRIHRGSNADRDQSDSGSGGGLLHGTGTFKTGISDAFR